MLPFFGLPPNFEYVISWILIVGASGLWLGGRRLLRLVGLRGIGADATVDSVRELTWYYSSGLLPIYLYFVIWGGRTVRVAVYNGIP